MQMQIYLLPPHLHTSIALGKMPLSAAVNMQIWKTIYLYRYHITHHACKKYRNELQFQVSVESNMDTLYWCKILKAPVLQDKHHIIGYEALLSKERLVIFPVERKGSERTDWKFVLEKCPVRFSVLLLLCVLNFPIVAIVCHSATFAAAPKSRWFITWPYLNVRHHRIPARIHCPGMYGWKVVAPYAIAIYWRPEIGIHA